MSPSLIYVDGQIWDHHAHTILARPDNPRAGQYHGFGSAICRPQGAPHGTIFETEDTCCAYLFVARRFYGPLDNRPAGSNAGGLYWATDLDEIYMWED